MPKDNKKLKKAERAIILNQCLGCQKIYNLKAGHGENVVSHGYCGRCGEKELVRVRYAEELEELSFLRRAIYIQMRSLRIRYEEAKREIPEMLIEEDGMIDFRMSVRL